MGRDALKVFMYEYLAEMWHEEYYAPQDVAIIGRSLAYDPKPDTEDGVIKAALKDGKTYLTVDVQKAHFWYVIRTWTKTASYLRAFGKTFEFTDFTDSALKFGCKRVYIDNSYEKRQHEVKSECWRNGNGWICTYGRDNIKVPILPPRQDFVNEGRRGNQKAAVWSYTFRPDTFKDLLYDLINQEYAKQQWFVFNGLSGEYVRQMLSEQAVNGHWELKKSCTDNHLWDCEVLQVLAATIDGMTMIDLKQTEKGDNEDGIHSGSNSQ